MIFHKLGISIYDVLDAAKTKWNFLDFQPGLVGGHCIGVDPYYLAFRAKQVQHNPEVVLAGRRIIDGMGKFVAGEIAQEMNGGGRVLVLGLTFKENVPDLRNSKVVDVVRGLEGHLATRVSPVAPVEAATVNDLALGTLKQPAFEAALTAVLEGLAIIEHVATDGLDDVAAGLARADHSTQARTDERAQGLEVVLEQAVHDGLIAVGRPGGPGGPAGCRGAARRCCHGLQSIEIGNPSLQPFITLERPFGDSMGIVGCQGFVKKLVPLRGSGR